MRNKNYEIGPFAAFNFEYCPHAVEECGIISALGRLAEKILHSSSLTYTKWEIPLISYLLLGGELSHASENL
jgi:hypothetical protein